MNYQETLDRLFQLYPSNAPDPTLQRAQMLNEHLNFPTRSYPTIHIAGSNGKGSVSKKIAEVLRLSGYRVGLYTSPHLFCFRERIKINQETIKESDVVEGMDIMFSIEKHLQLKATFFEIVTFLAFDYFRKQRVDVAVIETGIGGRLDATNVINPILSVITSISREHTQILGSHLEQIGKEKAGIIKPCVPVVLGPKARLNSIYQRANELRCPVFTSEITSEFFDEENSATAELAVRNLLSHFDIKPQAVELGLRVLPACRFERLGQAILDVAHNPMAIISLIQALQFFFPYHKFRFLVGFCKDKEYDTCLSSIAEVATHIHLVQANSLRAATLDELKKAVKQEALSRTHCHLSVEEGVKIAYHEAIKAGEILVICGSFYIMKAAKEALQLPENLKDTLLDPMLSSSSLT